MNKIKEIIIKERKWIVAFICIIGFLMFAEDVFTKEIMLVDIIGYDFVSKYIISDSLTPIVKFITNLGGTIFLIFLTILLLIIFLFKFKNKKIGFAIVINIINSALLNMILKNILQRPRPEEFRIISVTGYSFPSGHSMNSMAFYGFLIYLIYIKIENKYIKFFLISILSVLIILVGISRIYLGVHYTSDVLAGFLISIVYLILYINIINQKFNLEIF